MKRNFFLFAVIILTILHIWPIYVLEVRADGSEALLYHQKAGIGDTFDVVWTHSVTLQPVIETYQLEAPGRIPLIRMIFDDNGPNLPAQPEFNQKWTIAGGKFIVTNYDRVFERVPVTIGAVIANHTLHYRGNTVCLKDVYRPGGYVHIGMTKKNLSLYLLKGVEIWLTNQLKNLLP